MGPQAIIFDMDGLLIDSEPLWQQAEMEIFQTVDLTLTRELCQRTTGLRIDQVVDYWYQRQPWSGVSPQQVADRIVERVIELIIHQGQPMAGVEQVLSQAQNLGVPIGLASSSAYSIIEAVLKTLGIATVFQQIYSATEEHYGKPHPGVFLTTADRIGVEPVQCLVLEDSLNGVLAAKAARMTCIAVPEGYPRQDPRFVIADQIVGSLLDVDLKTRE